MNTDKPAFPFQESHDTKMNVPLLGLTKLEYALIMGHYEPSKEDIEAEYRLDKNRNPHNEPHKPALRSHAEIVKHLKVKHYSNLLN